MASSRDGSAVSPCAASSEDDGLGGSGGRAWGFAGSDCSVDGAGVSLLEAFEDFEVRAEQRTAELLVATDRQLFQDGDDQNRIDTAEDDMPAHFSWSDQYRQTKPPEFNHWRYRFLYLQAEGRAPQSYESQEHIQWIPPPEADAVCACRSGSTEEQHECAALCISGVSCLEEPPDDPELLEEEFFAWDGTMEETLAEDIGVGSPDNADPDAERLRGAASGCLSPRSSQLEETLNGATLATFSSTVAILLAPVFKTLLLKKQADLRAARELAEAKHLEEIARQQAVEEEKRAMEEQLMAGEETRQQALTAAIIEAEQREAERRELLEKERLAENDEEEIKIRTLAYTHTREWFQPNKKCFSHRGRQFTYLKPVLMVKDTERQHPDDALPSGPQGAASRPRRAQEDKQAQHQLQSKSTQSSRGWCNGDINAPRPSSGPSRPHRTGSAEKQQTWQPLEVGDGDDKRVRLPLIKTHAVQRVRDTPPPRPKATASFEDDGLEHSSVRAPSKVYVVEPYRIPPPLLADSVAARKTRTNSNRSNQANDQPNGKDRMGQQ